MASSNRHWPSMFKSKPNNHQRQHELNSPLVSSAACHRTTAYTPGLGCEDRAPEPKPRWNPRPEQIRILESIFNSGMVNPPRDEIRKIRAQLQEYGQVGDANVFYWFQNRKSRSKHKQRHAAAVSKPPATTTLSHPRPATTKTSATALNSYSSSSSDKSSTGKTISAGNVIDLMNSPTASVNNQHHQTFVPTSSEFLSEPFFFPAQQSPAVLPPPPPPPPLELGQGYGFSGGVAADQDGGNFLLSELMLMSNCPSKMKPQHEQQHHSYAATAVSNPTPHFIPPDHNQILQGLREPARSSSTVFINDVCFEVGVGPFSVREAFGDDAVLIQSSGQPVLTNDWGITIQPLQHGGFYYLLRPFASAPSPDDRTIDLI